MTGKKIIFVLLLLMFISSMHPTAYDTSAGYSGDTQECVAE